MLYSQAVQVLRFTIAGLRWAVFVFSSGCDGTIPWFFELSDSAKRTEE